MLCRKSTGHLTHTRPPSPVTRRSHGEVVQPRNPMYPAVEVSINGSTKPALWLSAKKDYVTARPILLTHTLEISCSQSSATWFNASHQSKWPKAHKPKTIVDSTHSLQAVRVPFRAKRDGDASALGHYLTLTVKENAKQ